MMRLLMIFIFLLSKPAASYSQKTYINQLLNSNKFFEREMLNLEIKQIEMLGDRVNYEDWDWNIGAELGRIHKSKFKYDYTSSADYAQNTSQQVRKISSDLSKNFFSNGSELSFSFDRSLPVKDEEMHDKNGYQKNKITTEYLDEINVSWTLPLLKNRNGVLDQKTYDLAVLDFFDEKLVLAEAQEDFIEDKVIELIDWVDYQWQLTAVNNIIGKLTKALNTVNILPRDANTLTRSIDKYQRLLLNLKSKLKAQNGLLLDSISTINFANNPPVLEQDFKINFINDLERYSQSNIRDLRRIKLEMRKNNRYIKAYQNSKLPELDFTLSASKDDNKGNYTSYSKSSGTEYEAKFVFSYPLSGDTANQVYLDKYRLKARQLEIKYNNKLKAVIANVNKIGTDIKQGLVQLALVKQQLKTLKLNHELNLFLEGRSKVRFIIDEQDDYLKLQFDHFSVLIELYKNKLKYDSLLDRLLPN